MESINNHLYPNPSISEKSLSIKNHSIITRFSIYTIFDIFYRVINYPIIINPSIYIIQWLIVNIIIIFSNVNRKTNLVVFAYPISISNIIYNNRLMS